MFSPRGCHIYLRSRKKHAQCTERQCVESGNKCGVRVVGHRSSRQVTRTYYYYHYCAPLDPFVRTSAWWARESERLILAVHSSLAIARPLRHQTLQWWLPADTLTCLISSSKWCFRLAHSWSGANPGAQRRLRPDEKLLKYNFAVSARPPSNLLFLTKDRSALIGPIDPSHTMESIHVVDRSTPDPQRFINNLHINLLLWTTEVVAISINKISVRASWWPIS
jgi:hypothetical protein